MTLTQAIDATIDYIREHSEVMTRTETEEFKRLAEQVYLLAYPAGLVDAIPKVPELRPELESQDPPLPPVQFIGKLNLPGDWEPVPDDGEPLPISWVEDPPERTEPVFLVGAPPRWFADMAALRALAEQRNKKGGRPKKEMTPSKQKVLSALVKHHGYDNGSITNPTPADYKTLLELSEVKGKATITRFFKDQFGVKDAYDRYKAACNNDTIGYTIAKWLGDIGKITADLDPESLADSVLRRFR